MPFASEKQRRFLWANRPDIAQRWAHEYPNRKPKQKSNAVSEAMKKRKK
jgi:hypothetical protein